jgi:hypothetical protein
MWNACRPGFTAVVGVSRVVRVEGQPNALTTRPCIAPYTLCLHWHSRALMQSSCWPEPAPAAYTESVQAGHSQETVSQHTVWCRCGLQAGVAAIAHPGGSIRDQDAVDCCNKYGVAIVTTGVRHFKH